MRGESISLPSLAAGGGSRLHDVKAVRARVALTYSSSMPMIGQRTRLAVRSTRPMREVIREQSSVASASSRHEQAETDDESLAVYEAAVSEARAMAYFIALRANPADDETAEAAGEAAAAAVASVYRHALQQQQQQRAYALQQEAHALRRQQQQQLEEEQQWQSQQQQQPQQRRRQVAKPNKPRATRMTPVGSQAESQAESTRVMGSTSVAELVAQTAAARASEALAVTEAARHVSRHAAADASARRAALAAAATARRSRNGQACRSKDAVEAAAKAQAEAQAAQVAARRAAARRAATAVAARLPGPLEAKQQAEAEVQACLAASRRADALRAAMGLWGVVEPSKSSKRRTRRTVAREAKGQADPEEDEEEEEDDDVDSQEEAEYEPSADAGATDALTPVVARGARRRSAIALTLSPSASPSGRSLEGKLLPRVLSAEEAAVRVQAAARRQLAQTCARGEREALQAKEDEEQAREQEQLNDMLVALAEETRHPQMRLGRACAQKRREEERAMVLRWRQRHAKD